MHLICISLTDQSQSQWDTTMDFRPIAANKRRRGRIFNVAYTSLTIHLHNEQNTKKIQQNQNNFTLAKHLTWGENRSDVIIWPDPIAAAVWPSNLVAVSEHKHKQEAQLLLR